MVAAAEALIAKLYVLFMLLFLIFAFSMGKDYIDHVNSKLDADDNQGANSARALPGAFKARPI